MSLKKYEAFVKTVELGSLTKAAQALGSTQSRISHILGDLEGEYGFSLLNRSRGGIQLTESGALVLAQMKNILEENRKLEELVADIQGADAGIIRLGAFTSVAVHWLPGIIRDFEMLHPNVKLEMYNGDYHDIAQWLESGRIDLGFVSLPAPAGMDTVPLKEDPLVAILPQGHRLAGLPGIPLKELEAEPFITLLQSSAQDIYRSLERAEIRPNVRFSTKDDYAIIAMVEQGLGISIVPQLLLEGSSNRVAVKPLEPAASRSIALALPPDSHRPAVDAFIDTARCWLQKNR